MKSFLVLIFALGIGVSVEAGVIEIVGGGILPPGGGEVTITDPIGSITITPEGGGISILANWSDFKGPSSGLLEFNISLGGQATLEEIEVWCDGESLYTGIAEPLTFDPGIWGIRVPVAVPTESIVLNTWPVRIVESDPPVTLYTLWSGSGELVFGSALLVQAVPEPQYGVMVALGMVVFSLYRRFRR